MGQPVGGRPTHVRTAFAALPPPAPRRRSERAAGACAARRRHARGRRRQRPRRIDRGRRPPRDVCCTRRAIPDFPTMTRSALKPFQAMPFVAAGGIGASASRRPRSRCFARATRASRATSTPSPTCWRVRATSRPTCNAARTRRGHYEVRGDVPPPPPYSPLEHNCSGKHSGMLAYCVQCGLPKESYLEYEHPLQQAIRRGGRPFHVDARGRSRLRDRRLLGAELCGAARSAGACLRAPRDPAGRRGLRAARRGCWRTR